MPAKPGSEPRAGSGDTIRAGKPHGHGDTRNRQREPTENARPPEHTNHGNRRGKRARTEGTSTKHETKLRKKTTRSKKKRKKNTRKTQKTNKKAPDPDPRQQHPRPRHRPRPKRDPDPAPGTHRTPPMFENARPLRQKLNAKTKNRAGEAPGRRRVGRGALLRNCIGRATRPFAANGPLWLGRGLTHLNGVFFKEVCVSGPGMRA